ncbi:MAG TPA: FUSC family protein [Candidatus Acidoferrales bacterium]|nr:FUSC family protein [Candidatus Acidoferrales bacterium]
MLQVFQRIVTSAFRMDVNAVDPVFSLRCGAGVAVAILAGYATGVPIFAVAAGMGAMSTGFGSLQGLYRTRAATMLQMAFAMAFSTAIAQLCSHSVELGVLALALWGFGYGMIAALGPAEAAIGVNAVIALVIFEHFPQPLPIAVGCVLLMFGGGLLQTLLLVVLWPIQRYPLERKALATAYLELAAYAQSARAGEDIPPSASLAAVRKALADPQPFGRRATTAAFQTLLDEAERIRASLALLASSAPPDFEEARPEIAAALRAIAQALQHAHAPDDEALRAQLDAPPDDSVLRALYGQLRAAWRSADVPLRGVALPRSLPYPTRLPQFDEPVAIMQRQLRLDSPFFRHAVRLAAVLATAGVLAEVLPVGRGYWITLTAALVLRPDFTTTLSRGFARIGGTVAGAVAATAIVLAVPGTPHVYLVLAIAFAALCYPGFQLNYATFSFAVTAYVVFILALLGTPEKTAVENRLVATVAGGALAMFSYLLFPTWESPHTRTRLRALSEKGIEYSAFVLEGLADPAKRDVARMRSLRSNVWNVRAAAEESLERMLSEPHRTHEMTAEAALGIMAATQRLGLANTALSSLYQDPQTPAFPQLAPLAQAAAAATPDRASGLRDAYATVAKVFPHDDAARALLGSCDLLVDSINTIVELWTGSA